MQFAVVSSDEDHTVESVSDFLDVLGHSLLFSYHLLEIYSFIEMGSIGEILPHHLDVLPHVMMEDLADPFKVVAVDLQLDEAFAL